MGKGDAVSSRYTAHQRFQRFGGFLRGRWDPFWGMIRGFVGTYSDRQTGRNYAESLLPQQIDYEEGQRGLRGRLFYEPETGPLVGLEYAAFQRHYSADDDPSRVGQGFVFAPWTKQYWGFGPSDYALVVHLGYRFPQGRIVAGVSYDIDADDDFPADHSEKEKTRRFDGGFGRLILTW